MARKSQPNPRSFEEAIDELEAIIATLDAGEAGIEQALSSYERGAFLLRYCRSVLDRAEKRVEQLVQDEATAGGEPPASPSQVDPATAADEPADAT